ncbi:hypothetical protein GXW82_18010 [Streptacidiphilus sp. 4-A2]|nr:hypothetical protein [Streptacidiphilus sp. 4-A2]
MRAVPLASRLRLLRAAAFAAVCLVVSATAHTLMSGQPVPSWALAVGFASLFLVAMGLTGRECSFLGIAAAVLVGELGLDLFFSVAQSAVPVPGSAAARWSTALLCLPGQHGSSLPPGMSVTALLRAVGLNPALAAHPPTAALSVPMPGAGAAGSAAATGLMSALGLSHGLYGMLAVHALAGLLSSCWLRGGEAAAFALLRALAAAAVGLLRLTLLLGSGAAGTPQVALRRLEDVRLPPLTGRFALLHSVVRRGPPRPVAALA